MRKRRGSRRLLLWRSWRWRRSRLGALLRRRWRPGCGRRRRRPRELLRGQGRRRRLKRRQGVFELRCRRRRRWRWGRRGERLLLLGLWWFGWRFGLCGLGGGRLALGWRRLFGASCCLGIGTWAGCDRRQAHAHGRSRRWRSGRRCGLGRYRFRGGCRLWRLGRRWGDFPLHGDRDGFRRGVDVVQRRDPIERSRDGKMQRRRHRHGEGRHMVGARVGEADCVGHGDPVLRPGRRGR